ncbi:gluconokinase, partial [Candidatus Aerophobetes bacterium]|nr:gluconokinase [Candidatus Aerophobetes bacterium]
MEKEAIIGVDIGTAGVRAIAFTERFEKISSLYLEHSTISQKEDQAEQDAEEIYKNLIICLKEVSKSCNKVLGISFSSVFHSLVGIDKEGNPLTPLYPFTDLRAREMADIIKKELPDFYIRTGCPPHPIYPAAKILWLREKNPSIFKKIRKFTSIKSYILGKLTGNFVEDTSVASGSGLLNIHSLLWDKKVLDFLCLKEENLPFVVEATKPHFMKKVPSIEKLEGVPVYPGGGDGVLSHLASGGLKKGRVSSTVGSSGAIRIAVKKPFLHPKQSTWCYHLYKNWWISGGAINNGGLALRWLRDKLFPWQVEEAKK